MVRRTCCIAIAATVVVACAGTRTPGGPAAERADAREAAATDRRSHLRFVGEFSAGSDPRAGITAMLDVITAGVGPAKGQRLQIVVRGASRLGPGRYAIGPMPPRTASRSGAPTVTVLLYRTDGTLHRSFVSRAGEMVLTVSTPTRLEGALSFTAAEYCAASTGGRPYQRGPCRPTLVAADAPGIGVSADFTATPESPKHVVPASR